MRVTVHLGPKGGTEYRLHDDARGTFRVVSRYQARPYMDAETRTQAEAMEAARAKARQAKVEQDACWRAIMRGG